MTDQNKRRWDDIDTSDWPELDTAEILKAAKEFKQAVGEEAREHGFPWPRLGSTAEEWKKEVEERRKNDRTALLRKRLL